MISMNLTLVRSKETMEPVAVFDEVGDIISLGKMIDEVTDPSVCEYADVIIYMDFSILFHDPSPDWLTNDDQMENLYCNASMSFGMIDSIMEKFQSSAIEWCEMPVMNYLSLDMTLNERMGKEDLF